MYPWKSSVSICFPHLRLFTGIVTTKRFFYILWAQHRSWRLTAKHLYIKPPSKFFELLLTNLAFECKKDRNGHKFMTPCCAACLDWSEYHCQQKVLFRKWVQNFAQYHWFEQFSCNSLSGAWQASQNGWKVAFLHAIWTSIHYSQTKWSVPPKLHSWIDSMNIESAGRSKNTTYGWACKQALCMGYSEICFRIARGCTRERACNDPCTIWVLPPFPLDWSFTSRHCLTQRNSHGRL